VGNIGQLEHFDVFDKFTEQGILLINLLPDLRLKCISLTFYPLPYKTQACNHQNHCDVHLYPQRAYEIDRAADASE